MLVKYDMAVKECRRCETSLARPSIDAELRRKLLELVETSCAAVDARLEVSLLFKSCHW